MSSADFTEVHCPHCQQLYRLTADQARQYSGRTVNCKKCQQAFAFPDMTAEASPEPQPVAMDPAYAAMTSAAPAMPPAPMNYAPRYARPGQGFDIGAFLMFRWMVAPWAIMILFWIGVLFCLWSGVSLIITSFDAPVFPRGGFGSDPFYNSRYNPRAQPTSTFSMPLFLLGLAWTLIGPIIVRIYCEILIVVFRVYDTLGEIRDTLRNR